MNMRTIFFIIFLTLCLALSFGQEVKYNTPQAGNPIIPGYFADPTIQKFGDTYYLYATTDGNGGGLGPSQVWTSKDFVNWSIQPMNWPNTHYIWAPDVMKGKDGKYYMYYCQPCQIYCGVSDTPVGPWKNILGEEEAVLVPDRYVKMSITLDGQTFVDDDGSVYLYWGTWGIYPNHGCGVGKLNLDMKSFSDTTLIPNTQITDFFEAPYVFKRNGIYYLTYSSGSCHDNTYRVQYATSKPARWVPLPLLIITRYLLPMQMKPFTGRDITAFLKKGMIIISFTTVTIFHSLQEECTDRSLPTDWYSMMKAAF